MILNTIAMVIGYIVIGCLIVIALVIIFATVAKHISDQNEDIYRREFNKKYGMDPHIEKKLM